MKLVLIALMLGAAVMAAPPTVNINDDPYVKLYQVRAEVALANVERERAVLELNRARYQMSAQLFNRAAVSREELLIRKSEMETAAASLTASQLRAKEMAQVLEVVKFLREAGRDVPLFPGGS